MKSKVLVSTILAAGTLLALGGCGKDKANAIRDYSGFKTVPAADRMQSTQSASDLSFGIKVVDLDNGQIPTFQEELLGSVRIQLQVYNKFIPAATLVIVEQSQASGATLTPTSEPGIFALSWAPPKGTAGNVRAIKSIPITVDAEIVGNPLDPSVSNFHKPAVISIPVTQNTTEPKFVSDNHPITIEEGQFATFSINIADGTGGTPELDVSSDYRINLENPLTDALPFMKFVGLVNSGSNATYKYTLAPALGQVPPPPVQGTTNVPDKNAAGIELCFNARVFGSNGAYSYKKEICTNLKYAAQPPVYTFLDDPQGTTDTTQIVAGEPLVLKFDVKAGNGRGIVSVTDPTKTIASWPSSIDGKPKFHCDAHPGDTSIQSCEIDWTPSCKITSKTAPKLTLSAHNTFADKTSKSNPAVRFFNVSKVSDSCQVADVKPAPAPAPVKPVAKKAGQS